VLQYLAIDDSKIEPSRQVASNSENQAESNSSAVNPPAVTRPGLQQQSRSQTEDAQASAKEGLYRQEQEKRQVEESDRQLKEAEQLSEAQSRRLATITEVAITIFVLLCGVAVAFFLRVKRQTAAYPLCQPAVLSASLAQAAKFANLAEPTFDAAQKNGEPCGTSVVQFRTASSRSPV
jgi:uncharacterized membrane protein